MEIENLLVKIPRILRKLEIPYLITGGIAVAVWGRPRVTFDIDIVVELKKPKLPFCCSARQLEDIESILKISKVDLKYIRKWARKQSTIDVFNKVFQKVFQEKSP